MLLTIQSDSSDLSHLLHKHPNKVHSKETSFGLAHVFYPEPQCAALLLEVDPIKLTKRGGGHGFALKPYVNDRTYVACSFLSVALNDMYRSAMGGRCSKKPEAVEQMMTLKVVIPCLPSRGGQALLERLFGPLGYHVNAESVPLDEQFPEWGQGSCYHTTLEVTTTLYKLLRHLYILIPVLDNEKHYWVGKDEVEKLLHKGEEWLADHPERDLIVTRYLKHQRGLAKQALETLADPLEDEDESKTTSEERTEKRLGLHQQRLRRVADVLKETGAKVVADLGCGEGKLVRQLLKEKQFEKILAMDVSLEALERTESSLDRLHESKRSKVELLHGSLLYDDRRLQEAEAAALVEVIEHLEPDRLSRVAQNLFDRMRPRVLILTTPNREYNAVWESLTAGKFRHHDHRFEWTRQEFREWTDSVKNDYEVSLSGIGEEHPDYGCPSQMAVFRR
jgi:3' terminal RNA ribose 2'-O-methyltransferase Hen1